MKRSTLQVHKTRVAALLLLVIFTAFLLLSFPITHSSNGDLYARTELSNTPEQLSTRVLPRVESEDENWLGYPKEELSTRKGSSLGEKGKLAVEGWNMLCKMTDPEANVPSTPYKEYSDLGKYGYVPESTSDWRDPTDAVDFTRLSVIGLSKADEDWQESLLQHKKGTPRYPATEAYFENLIDVKYGAIIALDNKSPDFKNKEKSKGLQPYQIVPLKHWSDIIWLEYEHRVRKAGSTKVAPLEHVIQHYIITRDTIRQMQLITGKGQPDELGQFPGVSYAADSPQGMAMLATLHGKGVVWLLVQHKDSLGWRSIDRIHVYACDESHPGRWCVYFHITKVG